MTLEEKIQTQYYTTTKTSYCTSRKNKEQNLQYRAEMLQLESEFFDDALEELGLTGHPKNGILCEKAWDLGHANGFMEVWNYMVDLSEFLKD